MSPTPGPPARLPPLEASSLDREAREIAEEIASDRGRLPTPFRVWLQRPPLASRMHVLGSYLSREISLDTLEVELAILMTARRAHADYVFAVHTRAAADAGLDSAAVDDIAAGERPKFEEPRLAAIAELLSVLFTEPDVPSQQTFDRVTAVLGAGGVADLLALVGYFTAVGLAMRLYSGAADEPPR